MIMSWAGAYSAFAVEMFLRLVNLLLLHREIFVLT